jgi:ferredoxin-2, mitochondrial
LTITHTRTHIVSSLQEVSQPTAAAATTTTDTAETTVPITFVEADGTEKVVQAAIGKHMLDVAHDNDVELEGACGGELACSTCHLIFEKRIYDTLPPKLEDEEDMLDLAFEVTETYVSYESRCE